MKTCWLRGSAHAGWSTERLSGSKLLAGSSIKQKQHGDPTNLVAGCLTSICADSRVVAPHLENLSSSSQVRSSNAASDFSPQTGASQSLSVLLGGKSKPICQMVHNPCVECMWSANSLKRNHLGVEHVLICGHCLTVSVKELPAESLWLTRSIVLTVAFVTGINVTTKLRPLSPGKNKFVCELGNGWPTTRCIMSR